MNGKPFELWTRRRMVRSLVSGSILLPGILSQLLAAEARGRGQPARPASAASARQSQAGDLFVHDRRGQPYGFV